ncbi:ornithine-acyl-ACP acyltransferase [Tabrizicola sp. TH137]|uniref:GNAT family N-acetyltransferase n=1 Tax=Tabrizicola sp. TH137 TaxID=2067452 RepID=UPI000C7C4954|nr:GNAT family N-acetyltransferase [Tabrizicola sp. TH137]PLL13302.1 ornithine-acyl-ACP acyltransferase [Tabrizicola sp. TH137]
MEFSKGRYRVRWAEGTADLRAAQRLRHHAFRGTAGLDADAFDAQCDHLLIETAAGGDLVGTCRLQLLSDGAELGRTYTGQFYDLSAFREISGPFLEVGRFCMAAGGRDPDALRLAWAALTRRVDAERVALLFGCSSFPGTDPAPYADAFAALAARHLAPERLRPGRKAFETINLSPAPHEARRAMVQMPPLLRSYLAMGGWVSDHAVVDRDLGTLHVCTGVEIAAVPPARARLLRGDAR